MGMQRFDKRKIVGIAGITIRKNGSISFNEIAAKEFPLKDKKNVDLYFDKEEQTIGIRLIDSKTGVAAFTLGREKGKTYSIACQSFLKQCGVDFTSGSKVYPATYDAAQEMIIAKIG